ncbi:hypothetical protein BV882_39780 [Streptomyces sp. 46]|nr:hypothetical protein BV882_39780 [Streptomyces sp. 46]
MPAVNGPRGPRRSDHCPESTIPNRLVVKYPENANAYRDTPFRSRAATGIAVPTAVASKAMSSTTETIPTLNARYAAPSTPSSRSAAEGGPAASSTSASRGFGAVMAASVRCTRLFDPCPETVPV